MAPASGRQWLVTITRLGRGRIGHMALSPWCTARASKCASTSSLRVWDGLFQLGEFGTTDCVFGSGGLPLPRTPFASCPAPPQPITCSMDEDGKHVTVSNARVHT